jgi:capsular polysaccharide export protein
MTLVQADAAAALSPIALCAPAPVTGALAALFPEFNLAHGRERPAAIAVWTGFGTQRARRRGAALGIPLVHLTHGLLRVPPRRDANSAPILSVTARLIEGAGCSADFLDADRVLATRGWETPELLRRAASARRRLVLSQVGGEWWSDGALPASGDVVFVLIEGTPSAAVLDTMLNQTLAESPPRAIVIVVAAETVASPMVSAAVTRGCRVLTGPVDPWRVATAARCVYTTGGEAGFLALLAGCEVYCFGPAFYSGWGVTRDHAALPQKSFRRTVDEIFAGACLLATRCRDPFHNTLTAFEEVASILADWRRVEEENRSIAAAVGMSLWKRRQVSRFLRSVHGSPPFCRTPEKGLLAAAARPGSAIAVWASRLPESLVHAAARRGIPLIRVEDGFIRSIGLGSDFLPAASLVLDRSGMYYDPRCVSDLERLLRESEFSAALLVRTRQLLARLGDNRITKYNLASLAPPVDYPAGRRRILVPGQVEDDLSVTFGGAGVAGNRGLLARVRGANPDAFILYKPHPDVEAGHRNGALPDVAAKEFADRVVRRASIAALLDEIDEVHTLTSLAGFEALLRRRRVVVYGRPFYAGWGLTEDVVRVDRGRRLSLEELVAGALILYPRYLDPRTGLPCPPEIVIERLSDPGLWRPGLLVIARRLQGRLVQRWNSLRCHSKIR